MCNCKCQHKNVDNSVTASATSTASNFEWVLSPQEGPDTTALDAILSEVRDEVIIATAKFAAFNSAHEGYAVILEEVDELWDEVKANRGDQQSGLDEALQVAAMGVRYLLDLR